MPTNKKPIYVSNPNDPRIRAYNDSLTLYNFYNKQKKLENIKDILPFTRNPKRDIYQKQLFEEAKKIVNSNPNIKFGIMGLTKQKTEEEYKKAGSPDILHNTIKPDGTWMGEGANNNYSNVKPKQPYVYQKVEEKKKEKKPIITTDRRKVQAYNDSSFIKKNFNIFPKPKGYDQTLKRVGQDPSADYFPAPEQPYILKKEKKKIKKNIVPVPVKESIPKDTIPTVIPVVKPQVEKEPEPIVPKKLPGGSGPAAQYPNMRKGFFNRMKDNFSGLMQNRKVNAKNVNNITVTGPKFISGAKSVKQYRGDENLPEAKNGMKKGCGCKHSKSKYKYQDGTNNVTLNEDYMDYLNLLKDRLSKNSNGKNYYDFILNAYKKSSRHPELANRYPINKKSNPVIDEEEPEETTVKEKPQPPKRSGVHNTPIRKRKFFRFKEGSNALTIPEGSAIVTANGGKNKQALMAYKKGNYKLLNNIIDDMPEDNVDKAQKGKKVTKIKGTTVTDPTTREVFQEQSVHGGGEGYGSELPQDKAEEIYNMSEADLRKKHKGITVAQELARRQAVANKKDTFTFTYNGKEYKGHQDKGYSSGYKEQDMTFPGGPGGGSSSSSNTTKTPPDEYEEVDTDTIKPNKPVISTGETIAIGSVLAQGVPKGPRESYLNLGRYNYASQLPKTLQEISLAEQGNRNAARDIVAGDAGRYLAQSGSLSAARMKASNDAVIQDTLARQDILNKNVDLGNVENTTNRNLKDYYDDIKRQNVNDYNALLVKGGQSFDESFDTYQKMKNENQLKAQELQLLKESNPNYTMVKDPQTGLMKSVYKYKKVNPTGTQTTTGTVPTTSTSATGATRATTLGGAAAQKIIPKKVGAKKLKTYKRK